jgi:NitT/TauT family transport system substrate-binding protein
MWLVRSWLIGLVAAISLLAQGASKAEPVKIRVSWIAPLSNWASLLMEKKEVARHMGRTYIFEPVRYAGTPQMITALANNELEIANLAFSTLPLAIHNAGLSDLRVIADEFQDGMQDYYSQEYMVLADGPVKRLEDLKGRVIAINAGGSAVDVAMRKMLLNAGLEQKRDYVMI